MLNLIMDLFGWCGAALLLIPYFYVSTGKVKGDSKYFQLSNILGSILLTANSLFYGALPSVFVNIVWISIGILTLNNIRQKGKINNVNL